MTSVTVPARPLVRLAEKAARGLPWTLEEARYAALLVRDITASSLQQEYQGMGGDKSAPAEKQEDGGW